MADSDDDFEPAGHGSAHDDAPAALSDMPEDEAQDPPEQFLDPAIDPTRTGRWRVPSEQMAALMTPIQVLFYNNLCYIAIASAVNSAKLDLLLKSNFKAYGPSSRSASTRTGTSTKGSGRKRSQPVTQENRTDSGNAHIFFDHGAPHDEAVKVLILWHREDKRNNKLVQRRGTAALPQMATNFREHWLELLMNNDDEPFVSYKNHLGNLTDENLHDLYISFSKEAKTVMREEREKHDNEQAVAQVQAEHARNSQQESQSGPSQPATPAVKGKRRRSARFTEDTRGGSSSASPVKKKPRIRARRQIARDSEEEEEEEEGLSE